MSLAKSQPCQSLATSVWTLSRRQGNVVSLQSMMILASYGFFAIFSQGLTNSMASVVQKHGTLTGPGYFGVSIPNGLPRPFSLCVGIRGRVVIVWVSIPNGLPRPFNLLSQLRKGSVSGVSIPNGLPRPFSQIPRKFWGLSQGSFNPERAPQAI